MIYDEDKEKLKKYRHLIAALIDYSIGYFTPITALYALQNHKNGQPDFCEWYLDIAQKRGAKSDSDFLKINRDVINGAIKRRHKVNLKRCLEIVDRNISGCESIGASWF